MGDHPVLGYLVWAVLIGAVFAWEGLALSHISGSVPTLSAAFRAIMRHPLGRWVLFAVWLWVGWHVFVRGSGAPRPPGRLAKRFPAGWRALAAQVVATALGGYLLLMAVLTAFYYRVSKVGNHFLASAFTGRGVLAGLALPVFAAATMLTRRRRQPVAPADPPPAARPVAD